MSFNNSVHKDQYQDNKIGTFSVIITSVLSIFIILSLDPINQSTLYHDFADQRSYFGVANFWNVISNLPFLIVGCLGLFNIYYSKRINLLADLKSSYTLFFIGIFMVALGSSYYHALPSNNSLVWDRLPMTIAFMSLFSIVIGEYISPKLGKTLLWPLIILGISSVVYWNNVDDLRSYIIIQFLPTLLIPLILIFFKSSYSYRSGYWLLLAAYIIAKLLEHFDSQIYDALYFISGHSIKHLAAALGIYLLLVSFNKRRRVSLGRDMDKS